MTNGGSAVPTGLGFLTRAFPAMNRWAKLFRACGARVQPGAPGSPFCWANLGSMEWWRSNRNGRPEIVSRKLSAGRPEPSSGAHVVRPHTQDLRKVVYSILNEQNEYRDRRRLDQKSAQTHAS